MIANESICIADTSWFPLVCMTCKNFRLSAMTMISSQFCCKKGDFVFAWTLACDHFEEAK